ncbi:hypothetical protein [Lysinibacillus xylanilyticus]
MRERVAAAICFDYAKAKRQHARYWLRRGFTGRDGFSLRSSIANP